MRILVSGMYGFMGRELTALIQKGIRGAELAGGVDHYMPENAALPCAASFAEASRDADCVIDFSNHACTTELLDFCVSQKRPLVLATTGQTPEELAAIKEAANKIPLFFAANYSLGIALLAETARFVAKALPEAEIEIVEMHHDRKLDAPSGTALSLAKEISDARGGMRIVTGRSGYGKREPDEIGISAVRMGNIVGVHEIIIGTQNQTITLKHEAHSRALFAEGALAAAEFLIGKAPGLYDMKSLTAV